MKCLNCSSNFLHFSSFILHFIKEHFLEFELYNFTFTEQKNCLFCRKELFNEKKNKCWAIKEEDCVQIKCKDFPHSYHFYNEMKI